MPDIKTALTEAMNAWTKDDPTADKPQQEAQPKGKHLFKPTNNVSRETFNMVRDNPGISRAEVTRAMEARGYNILSVLAVLTHMVRQGLAKSEDKRLTALVSEYQPLKSSRALKRMEEERANRPKRKYVRKAVAPLPVEAVGGVAALLPTKEDMTSKVMISASWSADQIMDHLSIKQARALYDELKTIFGK